MPTAEQGGEAERRIGRVLKSIALRRRKASSRFRRNVVTVFRLLSHPFDHRRGRTREPCGTLQSASRVLFLSVGRSRRRGERRTSAD